METSIPADLLELKARFDHWRATRSYRHQPFPDDLRSAALELAQRYSPSLLQRVLKVQLWSLKKRVAAKAPVRPTSPKSSQPAFFKLMADTALTEPISAPQSLIGCRLQLERPDGARLTLTLPALDLPSIHRLCADFLQV
jgi:hypothetical protein